MSAENVSAAKNAAQDTLAGEAWRKQSESHHLAGEYHLAKRAADVADALQLYWASRASLLALQSSRLHQVGRRMSERTEYLRLARQTRRLISFAQGVNDNVMGNGLAYRRDALRDVIAETEAVLERAYPHQALGVCWCDGRHSVGEALALNGTGT